MTRHSYLFHPKDPLNLLQLVFLQLFIIEHSQMRFLQNWNQTHSPPSSRHHSLALSHLLRNRNHRDYPLLRLLTPWQTSQTLLQNRTHLRPSPRLSWTVSGSLWSFSSPRWLRFSWMLRWPSSTPRLRLSLRLRPPVSAAPSSFDALVLSLFSWSLRRKQSLFRVSPRCRSWSVDS